MTFKPYEFKYFLFHKKECPVCQNKLKRIVKKHYVGKERSVSINIGWVDMYEYKNYYFCSQCEREYTLNELAKGEK